MQPFGVAGHAREAGALLERLGVERAHVIGYSYGGAIALQLALDAPVLYVLGSESGPGFEGFRDHFVSVPETEKVVLPGLNHLLQMRDPALVAEAAAEFLDRHPL